MSPLALLDIGTGLGFFVLRFATMAPFVGTRSLVAPFFALILGCSVGCASAARVGGVRVESNVGDATLYVDEELRGPVSVYERHYIRLEPGTHRLTLEHSEYFSEYAEVSVEPNMAMSVSFEMRRRPE